VPVPKVPPPKPRPRHRAKPRAAASRPRRKSPQPTWPPHPMRPLRRQRLRRLRPRLRIRQRPNRPLRPQWKWPRLWPPRRHSQKTQPSPSAAAGGRADKANTKNPRSGTGGFYLPLFGRGRRTKAPHDAHQLALCAQARIGQAQRAAIFAWDVDIGGQAQLRQGAGVKL